MQEGLGFEHYQHRNNNYKGLCKYGKLMRLDFRKVFESGKLIGFYSVDISISPHYHFNQYKHNGNDFTPIQAIKTIIDILTYLGIEQREYEDLRVVNIEFGLNIIPQTDIKNLINGILCSKRTLFVVPNPKTPYSKISDTTKYKQIKAYAKGLQFADVPEYGINQNTFRFEVKSKQSKNIRKYGINTVADLLNLETYNRLGQILLDEWGQILVINSEPNLDELHTLRNDEVQFIQNAKTFDFWAEMYSVKFSREKEKYYNLLGIKNNLHTLIKKQIIDKLFNFQNVTNSTQRNPINREKLQNTQNTPTLINLENVTPQQNNRENNDEKTTTERSDKCNYCEVTGLRIHNQRPSKFINIGSLKFYKENHPDTYKKLEKKYLTVKQKVKDIELQLYFIAHNIRNEKTNPKRL